MSEFDGYIELAKEFEELIQAVEQVEEVLEVGAKALVDDLLKLPKPKSQIRKSGYTHMVDSFAYKASTRHKGEIDVGWGKYYGRFVEEGTRKMGAQPHLIPTFEKNKEKYYKLMIKKLNL